MTSDLSLGGVGSTASTWPSGRCPQSNASGRRGVPPVAEEPRSLGGMSLVVPRNQMVGIATINDDRNFGNRLQNFALQEALASLGWKAETVRNTPPPMQRGLLAKRAWHAVRKDGFSTFARRNLALLRDRSRTAPVAPPPFAGRREAAIRRFVDERINESTALYSRENQDDWASRYQKFVVGSDQVWNHGFRNAQGFDFLTFANSEQRVAYAASFGVPEVPSYLASRYRMWIEGIPHVSVREGQGAQIIRELTGREVPVVLDPTLLLDRAVWARERVLPTGWDGPYAVKFFLGASTPDVDKWVEQLAEERSAPVVDLNDLHDERVADLGPLEFVGALAGATFVATDSFHAGVFSLLSERPIVVKSRDNTDSRLKTLFQKHAIPLEETGVAGLMSALAPDWAAAADSLEDERAASWSFLREAVGRPPSLEVS